ncbi:MAG: hypothetical protein CMO55_14750 [Verrucomicrobiales bacterium]|nr:hypothetical protein [Verrucomicrobiales bacterium]
MSESHYIGWLSLILDDDERVRYAFVADSEGTVLGRLGDKEVLDCVEVVDESEKPGAIVSFYLENVEHEKERGPFVPRLHTQGRTSGAFGKPAVGFLVGMFADMPEEIYEGGGGERSKWISEFRAEMRELINGYPKLAPPKASGK